MNAAPPSGHLPPFLRIIARDDGALTAYDSLTGTIVTLSAQEIEALDAEQGLATAFRFRLQEKGMNCTDPAHDRAVFEAQCQKNRADNPTRNSFRIGFLMDRLNEEQCATAIATARRETEQRRGAHLFLHFWTWSPDAFQRLGDTAKALLRNCAAGETEISLTLDASFPCTEEEEKTLETLSSLPVTSRQAVFMLHETALRESGSPQAYAHAVFCWQSLFFRFGFTPAFIILISSGNRESMGEAFFEELCFSGVYPRNIHMSFIKTPPDEAALGCEMHGLDGQLHAEAAATLLARPTHQIVEPLALGYGDALRGALTRDARWPRLYHCPYTRPTLFFAGSHAGACPVALARAAMGDGGLLALLSPVNAPDADRMRRWRKRGPHSIDACRGCAAAALCASGCPLAAFEAQGTINAPDCPPLEMIERGLGTMLSRTASSRPEKDM